MKKTIVIFCRNVSTTASPFSDPYFWNAYIDFLLILKSNGVNAYFATDMSTYKGEGLFSKAYTTDSKVPADQFTVVENVHADLVYEKGGFTATDVLTINPPYMREVCDDKIATYQHFPQFQPKSYICNNREEVEEAFREIPTDLVVAKEPLSSGSKGVFIGSREQVLAEIPGNYPLFVQEFLDMSGGIPGLAKGMHDLRLDIVGGKVIGGKLREPTGGDYRSNLSRGGVQHHLTPEDMPEEPVKIAMEIDKAFMQYPERFYSADFAHTNKGWQLIELNSKPSLDPVNISPKTKQLAEARADFMIAICPEAE